MPENKGIFRGSEPRQCPKHGAYLPFVSIVDGRETTSPCPACVAPKARPPAPLSGITLDLQDAPKPGRIRRADVPQSCGEHGEFFPFVATVAGREILTKCPVCHQAEIDADRRRDMAKIQRATATAAARNAEIPSSLYYKTMAEFQTTTPFIGKAWTRVRAFVDRAKDPKNRLASMILVGGTGTGKSHLACAALHEICLAGRTGRYSTIGDMFRRIRSTWRESSREPEASAIAAFTDPEFLVLDEIGMQTAKDNGASSDDLRILGDIIDKRTWNHRPTIMITNLEYRELPQWIGERVISRMEENGGCVLPMVGPDFRRRTAPTQEGKR